ncbi:hypothetical protein RYX36_025711, partial [Vicia faba]
KFHGGRIPEQNIRGYTRSIVEGLHHIHSNGFVYCDIKLQNILVFHDGEIKIADFGLANKTGEVRSRLECRGTPMYMSPESVIDGEHESPADIWALGGEESPTMPEYLSKEGKYFVDKCFIKDLRNRWTIEMLLDHPFIEEVKKNVSEASPRDHFDFNDWVSSVGDATPNSLKSEESCQCDFDSCSYSTMD